MTEMKIKIRPWHLRWTNPTLYRAVMASLDGIKEKIHRRAVTEHPEWFIAEQAWGVHTYGLKLDEVFYFVQGRGDAEYEPAVVTEDLGGGKYLVGFEVPDELPLAS